MGSNPIGLESLFGKDENTKDLFLHVYTQKKGDIKAQQEGGFLQVRKGGLTRNLSLRYLDLGLLAFSTVRRQIFVV